MAWTNWQRPQHIAYINDSSDIGYTDGDAVLDRPTNIITLEPIYSVGTSANTPAVNRYGAKSLLLTDFEFSISGTVTGIQLETNIVRLNRVRDQRVQLWSGSAAVGDNRASSSYDARQVYGNIGDIWGISVAPDYNSSQFGVIIDLAPHDRYPSSTRPIIRWVQLRLYVV